MEIKSEKLFTEYDLLRLLLATMFKQERVGTIKESEIEKALYDFSCDSEFWQLFSDVSKTDSIVKEENLINLISAFKQAYTFGLLMKINSSTEETKYWNMVTDDEANDFISEYGEEKAELMDKLVKKLYEKK